MIRMPKAPPNRERQQHMFTCFPEQRPEKEAQGSESCIYFLDPWEKKKKKGKLSSNHKRRKEAGQVNFRDVLFTFTV